MTNSELICDCCGERPAIVRSDGSDLASDSGCQPLCQTCSTCTECSTCYSDNANPHPVWQDVECEACRNAGALIERFDRVYGLAVAAIEAARWTIDDTSRSSLSLSRYLAISVLAGENEDGDEIWADRTIRIADHDSGASQLSVVDYEVRLDLCDDDADLIEALAAWLNEETP